MIIACLCYSHLFMALRPFARLFSSSLSSSSLLSSSYLSSLLLVGVTEVEKEMGGHEPPSNDHARKYYFWRLTARDCSPFNPAPCSAFSWLRTAQKKWFNGLSDGALSPMHHDLFKSFKESITEPLSPWYFQPKKERKRGFIKSNGLAK